MDLRKLIEQSLHDQMNKSLILKEDTRVSESLKYHIDNNLPLTNNVFRTYSDHFFDLVNEVRKLWEEGKIDLNEQDKLMIESDLGIKIKVGKKYVYLDAPIIVETETVDKVISEDYQDNYVKLNRLSNTSHEPKKFEVYVKSKVGGVKKIVFESIIKKYKCDEKTDRTSVGYWKCNVDKFSKQLGLTSSDTN